MAKIVWTDESLFWLEQIHDHIAKDNPEAAIRVVEGIYDKVQMLRQNSHLGYRYEPISDREIRILLFGNYCIAYLLKDSERIDILGIYHSAMEIERFLK